MRLSWIEGTPLSESEESGAESDEDQDRPQQQNEGENEDEDDGGPDCLVVDVDAKVSHIFDDQRKDDRDSWGGLWFFKCQIL